MNKRNANNPSVKPAPEASGKSQPAAPKSPARLGLPPRLTPWLLALLLLLVTAALYWPTLRHDFVNFDDHLYVTANVHVQAGLTVEGIKWAFFKPESSFGYWHPLTLLSHMADCQLYGLKPWGHHLTSALLHAINTSLVFLLLCRLTGALWRSLLVAALFGLHPLHVESVAWVAERKDVLSGLFALLTLIFYSRYAQPTPRNPPHAPRNRLFYLLSLVFFALGLMSKPMLVTLPCLMLLLDYWPLRRFEPSTLNSSPRHNEVTAGQLSTSLRLVLEKLPFAGLAAVTSYVTFVVSEQGGALQTVGTLPLVARCGNALVSYCRYLGKLFWPTDLAVLYPHPGYWPRGQVLLAAAVLLGISAALFAQRRRQPYLLMGWLWFCGMLVPTSGLVQVGDFAMADRYTYLPSIGALVLVIWGAQELTRHWHYREMVLTAASATVIALCFALTRQQLKYWHDSEALFRHALAVTENNYLAHAHLGRALDTKGQIDEAISQYREALRLKPGYAEAHNNLGVALDEEGQNAEAARHFQEALSLRPDDAAAHNNLGNALDKLGQIDEAIRQCREAIRLQPDYALAHDNLGAALLRKGQTDEAIHQFREAIRLQPDDARMHNNLGVALGSKGQIDDACHQYEEAIRLKADYVAPRNHLGHALAGKGQIDPAICQFQEVLQLKPGDADAKNNLARALEMKGKSNAPTSDPVKP